MQEIVAAEYSNRTTTIVEAVSEEVDDNSNLVADK